MYIEASRQVGGSGGTFRYGAVILKCTTKKSKQRVGGANSIDQQSYAIVFSRGRASPACSKSWEGRSQGQARAQIGSRATHLDTDDECVKRHSEGVLL